MQVKHVYSLLICSLLIFIGLPIHVEGTAASKEVKLSIFPKKELFDVQNMKPGDWTIRDLTVKNASKKDISYRTTVQYKSGSKELYEELMVRIYNQESVLFHGKLADLNELQPRKLLKNTDETLIFRIDFPWELGNEFQNLNCHFIINFFGVANGSEGKETPREPGPPKETDPGKEIDQPKEPNPDGETIPPIEARPDDHVDTPINPPDTPPNTDLGDPPDEPELKENDLPFKPEQEVSVPDENGFEDNQASMPVNSDNSGGDDQSGKLKNFLPNTATSIFNYLFGGGILIIVGLTILLLERRKGILP